jgi:DNA-binding XRE family transcriptional regulator/PHD/YefM family antitoxin component YafN of YafNO toxin-antitoxin module
MNEEAMNTKPSIVRTPGGEEIVLLSRAEYAALMAEVEAIRHDRVMADMRAGAPTLSSEDVLASLAEPTLLAFWRKKRGMTQAELAALAGISQSYLAAIEAGKRKGNPEHFLRMARALGMRVEDIVTDDPAPPKKNAQGA